MTLGASAKEKCLCFEEIHRVWFAGSRTLLVYPRVCIFFSGILDQGSAPDLLSSWQSNPPRPEPGNHRCGLQILAC
ncbi:hypothetical protein R1flu_015123 [Riccia fluitans]|uniref:Uncharacterized protein n=1 Tax=Riccia fluitans TaxID=41844 RepID=A0ABD1YI63_9MARC